MDFPKKLHYMLLFFNIVEQVYYKYMKGAKIEVWKSLQSKYKRQWKQGNWKLG